MDYKYQVMPDLTPDEYAELKNDIAERGVQVPIEFDTDGNVIDGYHRFKICQELGWIDQNGKILDKGKVPIMVRAYPDEDAKFTQARKLNLARRHLSKEQRHDIISDDIKADPTRPDRQIADDLGVHHTTVSTVRHELESIGEISQSPRKTSDGRTYPAQRKPAVSVFNPSARDAEALKDPDIQRRMAENENMNVAGAIREQKRDQLVEHLESVEEQEAKAVAGVYDVIVIDPPWPMEKIETDARPHAMKMDYPTMSIDEIKQLEIPAAADCHIFMWTTQKYVMNGDALDVLKAWGVKPVWCFTWVKDNGYKPFGLPKSNVEFVYYGHIGNPKFIDEKDFWSSIVSPGKIMPITGHSEKPDGFYDMVRRVTAGRRLDMFNRRKIDGFDTWGKEASD